MPAMFEIHEFPPTRSNRASWAFAEAGIDVNRRFVDLQAGEHRAEPFLSLNPLSYVPVLTMDGAPVIESAAIALVAAERAPEKGLIPPEGTTERALAYQWLVFAPAELDQKIAVISQHTLFRAPADRDPDLVSTTMDALRPRLSFLNEELEGREWLLDDFSVADIAVGHSLAWAVMANLLQGLPALQAYVDRLLQRPAFREVYGDSVVPISDPYAAT